MPTIGLSILSAVLLPATSAGDARPASTGLASRPNVLLIITDDQGTPDLSCHGNPDLQTPHLDRLHAQSVRLTDYHVDPTCSPTRSALMSGRYSSRTGVWHTIMGRSIIHPDERTVAELLQEGGYRTGMFGKWHLGDTYPCRPQDQGFEEVFYHGGGGVSQTPDWFGNDYFDDTYYLASRSRADARPDGALDGFPGRQGIPVKVDGYCTDVWFDRCMQFMAESDDRPFFAYLATNVPHGPNLVAEKYWKPFADSGLPDRVARFYGMLAHFDECVGRVLHFLEESGLADDTLVIFTTDNGSACGHYPGQLRGRKGSEYDGGHRVPFFLRWPAAGLEGGRDHDFLCAHVDVLPTLLDFCGLPAPGEPALDGRSLAPILRGKTSAPEDRTLFVHSQRIETPQKWRKSAVMTERWRLINGKELYDVRRDPVQAVDVAEDHADVVSRLRDDYEQWWTSLQPAFARDVAIVLGDPRANPTRLTAHDWHGSGVPWNQGHVRNRPAHNGDWIVDVATAGAYRFTLRAFPSEKPGPLRATSARVEAGGAAVEAVIDPEAPSVTLRLDLKPGRTRLKTTLTGTDGKKRGAIFLMVEREEPD